MSGRYPSSSSDSSSEDEVEVKAPAPRIRKAQVPEPAPEPKKTKLQKMIEEIRDKPIPSDDGKKYQRLAAEKRLAVIALKEKGIEDPEYRATRSAAGRWTVKKRKFPIDQSPDLDRTAGSPPLRMPEPAPSPIAPEPAPQKKDSLDLNWINMQATVNDSLKRDLESLSEKYEKLAQKEEKRKRLKAKMTRPVTPQAPPQKPPPQTAPAQPPPQPHVRPGLYHRAGKLSISQF
jgi:hypothetical protein